MLVVRSAALGGTALATNHNVHCCHRLPPRQWLQQQHRQQCPSACMKPRSSSRVHARKKKQPDDTGESFFVFDEETDGDEPPGPADDVQDASVTGVEPVAAEVGALSRRSGSLEVDQEPSVTEEQEDDGAFWENFFTQAQRRQASTDSTAAAAPNLPAVQEPTVPPLNLGDRNVDYLIPPHHYLDVVRSPFRYDTTGGERLAARPGDGADELPPLEAVAGMSEREVFEWAALVDREFRYRKEWEEEEYLEQYFEIASRQARAEVNRFAAVQRLATITRGIELQDEAGQTPQQLALLPPFVRASLVFDREFDWYNANFDESIMSKRAQSQELDQERMFGNIMVPEEMLAENPLLGMEAKAAREGEADPLHKYITGVLPGTAQDSEREERQQQYLTDLLGEGGEEEVVV